MIGLLLQDNGIMCYINSLVMQNILSFVKNVKLVLVYYTCKNVLLT